MSESVLQSETEIRDSTSDMKRGKMDGGDEDKRTERRSRSPKRDDSRASSYRSRRTEDGEIRTSSRSERM
ncbi:unnamed protein product, partial [Notodromas monacha]